MGGSRSNSSGKSFLRILLWLLRTDFSAFFFNFTMGIKSLPLQPKEHARQSKGRAKAPDKIIVLYAPLLPSTYYLLYYQKYVVRAFVERDSCILRLDLFFYNQPLMALTAVHLVLLYSRD